MTYLQLKNCGLRVRLTNKLPDNGIIVAHSDDIGDKECVNDGQYRVCLLVDRVSPDLNADFHVFHNPQQRLRYSGRFAYIPPWKQSDLIPRDPARGSRVESIGFFGYRENLQESLRSNDFVDALNESKLQLICMELKDWHDYRNIDVVLGVRTFGDTNLHPRKPALKLINAWAAGAAAVLGAESAYRIAGAPNENYLEATNHQAVLDAVLRLRSDKVLFQKLILNGQRQSTLYTDEQTILRWTKIFNDAVIPEYLALNQSGYRRKIRTMKRSLLHGLSWRYRTLLDTA